MGALRPGRVWTKRCDNPKCGNFWPRRGRLPWACSDKCMVPAGASWRNRGK